MAYRFKGEGIKTDTVELVFGIISALGVVFAVITFFTEAKRRKKQDTLNAYGELQEKTLSKINQYLPAEIREAMEDKKSPVYAELSGYLAEIERFCIGINTGIYDFDTFYELSHGYFDSDRGKLKPRLMPLLETKLENAKEDYFANLHEVWKRMEKKNGGGK